MSEGTAIELPLGWLARGISALAFALAFLGGLGTVGIMVLINADVIGRGAFGTPVPATAELVSAAIVSIVFLQLPYAIRAGRAIRSDMLIDSLRRRGPRWGHGLDAIHHLVGTVMLTILVYYLWPQLVTTLTQERTVGLYGVFIMPRWPFTLAVFSGAALATVLYGLLTIAYATRAIRGEVRP
ncbi:MAG: TRAP transporter small permease [Rhodobacteraceae bacterium]|nr:TRAP transporter small permease [Paracoccaceae bacterium]